jgi:hypothetical protein
MRRNVFLVFIGFSLVLGGGLVEARRKAPPRRAPPPREEVNKQAMAAIDGLVGDYKFGITPEVVVKLVTQRFHKEYVERIRKAQGQPLKQDRLRDEQQEQINKVRKSLTKFDGKRTGWDSSIIDDQFKHNNNESLVVDLEKEKQRFFFFHHGKLYKQFIAFNADHPNYKGLNFPQFLGILIKTFGQGEPVFQKDAAGNSKIHHVLWKGAGKVAMWAIDKTTIYGNFCLVIYDTEVAATVDEGRKASGGSRPAVDPLIDSVTKPRREDEY